MFVMLPMKILITGTPGVGKTTISKKIADKFGLKHIELSKFIKENELYDSYDKEFDTFVFDEEIVQQSLTENLRDIKGFIIDTHSPECVSSFEFDKIYVLKLENDLLFERLKSRGYNDNKIKENINCEIFGITEDTVEEIFGEEYQLVGDLDGCISEKEMIRQLEQEKSI